MYIYIYGSYWYSLPFAKKASKELYSYVFTSFHPSWPSWSTTRWFMRLNYCKPRIDGGWSANDVEFPWCERVARCSKSSNSTNYANKVRSSSISNHSEERIPSGGLGGSASDLSRLREVRSLFESKWDCRTSSNFFELWKFRKLLDIFQLLETAGEPRKKNLEKWKVWKVAGMTIVGQVRMWQWQRSQLRAQLFAIHKQFINVCTCLSCLPLNVQQQHASTLPEMLHVLLSQKQFDERRRHPGGLAELKSERYPMTKADRSKSSLITMDHDVKPWGVEGWPKYAAIWEPGPFQHCANVLECFGCSRSHTHISHIVITFFRTSIGPGILTEPVLGRHFESLPKLLRKRSSEIGQS